MAAILGADGQPLSPAQDGYGEFALPHAFTFQALYQGADRTYIHDRFDEALRYARQQALVMLHDPALQAPVQERKLGVVSLKHHIECEDEQDPEQVRARDLMTRIVKRTPNLKQLFWNLLDAVWYGRAGVQVLNQWDLLSLPAPALAVGAAGVAGGRPQQFLAGPVPRAALGASVTPPAAKEQVRCLLVRQHMPVQGDKIGHKLDGTPYVLVNSAEASRIPGAELTLTTTGGHGLVLRGDWRERFILHRHLSEDRDFLLETEQAEAVHGVGLRHVVFWLNFLKLELLEWITTYMERVGLGLTLWLYQAGNKDALAEAKKAAADNSRKNNLFVPVWPGQTGRLQGGVERVETPTAGVEALRQQIEYIDEKIERYVIGQTLSSDSEGSGLGGSGVASLHAQTKHKIIAFDADNLAETLTTDFVRVRARWAIPGRPDLWQCLRWVFDHDAVDPSKQLEAVAKASGLGVTFKENEVRGLTGLSDPGPGDAVVGGQVKAPGEGDGGGGEDKGGGPDDDDRGPAPFRRNGHARRYAAADHEPAARGYADRWNAAGKLPTHAELVEAGRELGEGDWVVYYDPAARRWHVAHADLWHGPRGGPERHAAYNFRAPRGGVTINGQFYRGGQFIPRKEAMDTGFAVAEDLPAEHPPVEGAPAPPPAGVDAGGKNNPSTGVDKPEAAGDNKTGGEKPNQPGEKSMNATTHDAGSADFYAAVAGAPGLRANLASRFAASGREARGPAKVTRKEARFSNPPSHGAVLWDRDGPSLVLASRVYKDEDGRRLQEYYTVPVAPDGSDADNKAEAAWLRGELNSRVAGPSDDRERPAFAAETRRLDNRLRQLEGRPSVEDEEAERARQRAAEAERVATSGTTAERLRAALRHGESLGDMAGRSGVDRERFLQFVFGDDDGNDVEPTDAERRTMAAALGITL